MSHTNGIQDTEQRFEEEKTVAYDKLSQFLVTLMSLSVYCDHHLRITLICISLACVFTVFRLLTDFICLYNYEF
jgi:hypothetical protein